MMDYISIIDKLEEQFPNAKCELDYCNPFELLVAVALSAQTTDIAVNKVTPALFKKFPTCYDLAKASLKEVENEISTIGLYHNKAKALVLMSQRLCEEFNGIVPNTRKQLMSLAGVGRKTANVVLSEIFEVPAIAVDTHVERISKRLGFAKNDDSINEVEKKLCRKIPRDRWNRSHHLFIFFGRYQCLARNPKCEACVFADVCKINKN